MMEVINSTMGLDVPASIAQANITLLDLQVGQGRGGRAGRGAGST